jgi:hypothetical protein
MLAETGKIDSTLIVMLHRKLDDSAVAKEKPRYVAKLDGKGNFRFKFLPAGTFALYALKDEGSSRTFMSPKQTFAFATKPVTIGPENKPQSLLAYLEKDTSKPKPARLPGGLKEKEKEKTKEQEKPIRYQTNLQSGSQGLLGDFSIEFTTPLKVFDTTKISFLNDQFQTICRISICKGFNRQNNYIKTPVGSGYQLSCYHTKRRFPGYYG